MRLRLLALVSFGSFFLSAVPVMALSGAQAEKVAESVLSPKVKLHLIKAKSTSVTGVDPVDWEFLYFDPFAENNGRLVAVHGTAILAVKEGVVEWDQGRLLAYKASEVLPLQEIHYDSYQALDLVKSKAQLGNVRLTTVIYELKLGSTTTAPVWYLTLYASNQAHKETRFGTARISAITGQIFSMDIELGKLQ